MTTDDNSEQDDPEAASPEVSHQQGVTETGETRGTASIRATDQGYWADLEVEYTWSANGQLFTVKTLRFRASSNGRSEGNIKLKLVSAGAGDTDWDELTKYATQDGEWHSFVNTRSVTGNVKDAVIHFNFIYDRKGVGDVNMTGQQKVVFAVPNPTITSPLDGDIPDPSINVVGRGGVYSGPAVITVHDSGGGLLGTANFYTDGTWGTTFEMPSGSDSLRFYAKQALGNGIPGYSEYISVQLVRTTLLSPTANAVVRADQIVFSGTGFPGTQVWAVVPNVGTELSAKIFIPASKIWSTPPKATLTSGVYSVQAAHQYGSGPVKYTEVRTFTVLGKLNINALTAPQDMNFTVTGTNGIVGAKVEVKMDWGSESFGDDTVKAGGNWSVNVRLNKAGPVNLVAEQIYQGVTSQRSDYHTFKIKPPKLTDIQVTYPRPGTVRFSGAGYEEATVEVHITGNGTPQGWDVVRYGTWAVEWSDQPPAQYQMDIRQKVADGSGWIYSDWSDRLTVTIPVPVPTLSVQVGEDRKPVFSGTGDTWPGQPGRIEVRREGETEPAVPIVDVLTANKTWSSTATEAWDPGTYYVQAWQWFNNLSSNPTELQRFTINAPLPIVEVRDDGLTPHFSGTCLDGAQVNLGFDGEQGTPHAATMDGPNWTFTREEPFLPGAYTARVTQTIGGQTSNEASQPFDVVVLQPVITSPVDEDVDHNPVIRGTGGVLGATMYVFDAVTKLPLGERPVTENQWSVSLENLSFGPHTVYAVQQYGEWPSEESQRVTFSVILLPPTIDRPQPGDRMPRIAVIDGYARAASGFDVAWVELWLEGAEEPLTTVRANRLGYWSYDAHLPVGEYVLRARQRFVEEVSAFGPDHPITVVPPIPVIESPALQQHIGATVTMSGHGYVGDWVEVAWSDAPDTVLGRTQVQANRTWSLALSVDRPAGEHPWIVRQECDDYRSDWSEARPVKVLSDAPVFTAPEAGHWFAGSALFEGTGETGTRIELSQWFDSRQVVSQGDSVTGGTWTASPDAPLLPGAHWLKARQDDSDWGDSLRFEVARIENSRGR
ncbi:hypothetical protein [Pseudomonas thivervalensis]|uniref:hypothetical protein n=1 Tax=Pseudomonas thivervalensis TaxID=86265 RepID=UPI003D9937D7